MFTLASYLDERRQRVDAVLRERMPAAETRPAALHGAMRYSVFCGGKRLRPLLCLAACEAVGGDAAHALVPAAAIELLHTYTLVHDDLPAMDDDDLRRGQPTTHKAFGEASAILAGDALLTLAFEWLAGCEAPRPYIPAQFALELARAAGSQGVIGGQVEDLAAEGAKATQDLVDYIHAHKTGDLIRASVRIGAIAGGASPEQLDAMDAYGRGIGLAFQIADDILDATSTKEELGKSAGSDDRHGKVTYVAVHGVDAARAKARALIDDALASLNRGGISSEPLAAIARFIVDRKS